MSLHYSLASLYTEDEAKQKTQGATVEWCMKRKFTFIRLAVVIPIRQQHQATTTATTAIA